MISQDNIKIRIEELRIQIMKLNVELQTLEGVIRFEQ